MVEFGSGPIKEGIDNTVFIVPGIIIVGLVLPYSFSPTMSEPTTPQPETTTTTPSVEQPDTSGIKPGEYGILGYESSASMWMFIVCVIITGTLIAFFAYKLVASLREKQRLKDEKKKLKLQRREKELKGKQKRK